MIRSACIGRCSVAEFSLGSGYCHFEAEAEAEAKSCSDAELSGNLDLQDYGECESCSSVSIQTVHTLIKVGNVASTSSMSCSALIKRQGIGPVITFKGENS
ncbi:hypothetical protein [Maridesulfovibrio sp.]|uniref:hypothetical protein n=1 Tax=Maridesulfovibrio sp. TaxID=2795000 RepID=UPI0029C9D0C4|nr:hypothetical protein [Maridesulfovibrio sp.]